MSDINFTCPHCVQSIVCEADYAGQQVACPNCQQNIIIPNAAVSSQTKPAINSSGGAASTTTRPVTPQPKARACTAPLSKPSGFRSLLWFVSGSLTTVCVLVVMNRLGLLSNMERLVNNPPPSVRDSIPHLVPPKDPATPKVATAPADSIVPDRTDWSEAPLADVRKAADGGNVHAQACLGFCYLEGQGVKKDVDEGVKWCRKAAERGNARAQNNLGWCYAGGIGVEKNLAEAAKWYRMAAEQGYEKAQANLRRLAEARRMDEPISFLPDARYAVTITKIKNGLAAVDDGEVHEYELDKAKQKGSRFWYFEVQVKNNSGQSCEVADVDFQLVDTEGIVYRVASGSRLEVADGQSRRCGLVYEVPKTSNPRILQWIDTFHNIKIISSPFNTLDVFKSEKASSVVR